MPFKHRRSWLNLPAHFSQWYPKLETSPADVLVLDLEDAVPADLKDKARNTITKLAPKTAALIEKDFFVRINGTNTKEYEEDLAAIKRLKRHPDGVILPMVREHKEILDLDKRLKDLSLEIVPVIELLDGEHNIIEIARASERVKWVQFAETGDYGTDYGLFGKGFDAMRDPIATDFAVRILKACHMLGKFVTDSAYPEIKNSEGLSKRCEWAARMGFHGKIALHPGQIETIHQSFTIKDEELQKARDIIEAFENNKTEKSIFIDGEQMINPPIYESAKKVLKRHE
jgi:citrate lyase beta subunit